MMDGEPIVAKVFATVELKALEGSAEKIANAIDDLRLPFKLMICAGAISMLMLSSAYLITALKGDKKKT